MIDYLRVDYYDCWAYTHFIHDFCLIMQSLTFVSSHFKVLPLNPMLVYLMIKNNYLCAVPLPCEKMKQIRLTLNFFVSSLPFKLDKAHL